MAHNPQPSAVQDAKGYFQKHPDRKRPGEPKPKAPLKTTAPKEFTKEQKAVWKELMRMLIPGVAYETDTWALRHYVILEAKYRYCTLHDKKFTADEHTKWLALCDRFGGNPSARTRIQVEASEEDDLDSFLSASGKIQ